MTDRDLYPDMPGHKVDGPSADAATAIASDAKTLRADVYRTLLQTAHGMTADELASELRRSILSVRPRVSELRRLGMIEPSGERGKNVSGMTATRWRPAGRVAV